MAAGNKIVSVSIRVYVEDARRYHSVVCRPHSTARHILLDMIDQGLLGNPMDHIVAGVLTADLDPELGQWALFELINDFSVERPLIDWERITDVIASWENCATNSIVARRYSLRRYLSPTEGVPRSLPQYDGVLHVQLKKGKFHKAHFYLANGQLYYYKDSKKKVEVPYTSLDHMQVYTLSQVSKRGPTKYAMALKNESSITLFENPENDYVRLIAAPDAESLKAWMVALRLTKNYLMYQEATEGLETGTPTAPETGHEPTPMETSPASSGGRVARQPSVKKPAPTFYEQLASGYAGKSDSASQAAATADSRHGTSAAATAHQEKLTASEISRMVLSQQGTMASGAKPAPHTRRSPSKSRAEGPLRSSPPRGSPSKEDKVRGPFQNFDDEGFKPGSLLSYDFQKIAETHKEIRREQAGRVVDPNDLRNLPAHLADDDAFRAGSLLSRSATTAGEAAPEPVPRPDGPLLSFESKFQNLGVSRSRTIGHGNHRQAATPTAAAAEYTSHRAPKMSLGNPANQELIEDAIFKPGSLLTRAKSQHAPARTGGRSGVPAGPEPFHHAAPSAGHPVPTMPSVTRLGRSRTTKERTDRDGPLVQHGHQPHHYHHQPSPPSQSPHHPQRHQAQQVPHSTPAHYYAHRQATEAHPAPPMPTKPLIDIQKTSGATRSSEYPSPSQPRSADQLFAPNSLLAGGRSTHVSPNHSLQRGPSSRSRRSRSTQDSDNDHEDDDDERPLGSRYAGRPATAGTATMGNSHGNAGGDDYGAGRHAHPKPLLNLGAAGELPKLDTVPAPRSVARGNQFFKF
ncbi:hypothetical protein IWQ60_011223 [Tieghemiomyces parasiticus]|uniref:PH domain-containing protein n=1 Tax=Tieghemiomyces parasiticus TaxID=78921 RepID=A0A9W8DLW8_9FUNG|nr:hypothetical protein IWQ60_011223 [Tieghemiomyces parasiticus]